LLAVGTTIRTIKSSPGSAVEIREDQLSSIPTRRRSTAARSWVNGSVSSMLSLSRPIAKESVNSVEATGGGEAAATAVSWTPSPAVARHDPLYLRT
jgi:hypothetical protein